jgi:hypothetical protein
VHAAGVFLTESGEPYAFCECGWTVTPGLDEKQLWAAANQHSDPEAIEQWVRDMQLNYPAYTREQIINMELD